MSDDLDDIKRRLAHEERKTPRVGGDAAVRRLVIFLLIAGAIALAIAYSNK